MACKRYGVQRPKARLSVVEAFPAPEQQMEVMGSSTAEALPCPFGSLQPASCCAHDKALTQFRTFILLCSGQPH